MQYELIVLDIDGTIRTVGCPISSRTRNVLDKICQTGSAVTLATGRTFQSALFSTTELSLFCPIISSQGAHIGDPVTRQVLWQQTLTNDMVLSVLEKLSYWNGELLAYVGDNVYANMWTPWVEGYVKRNKGFVRVVPDFRIMTGDKFTRIVAVGEENEICSLEANLKSDFHESLYITRSLPNFCEILNPKAGKHNALSWLCRYLGVDREHTIAFGNAQEDSEMLRWAGLGIAVGRESSMVIDAADEVAAPVEEDGVAYILEDMLHCGLIRPHVSKP